MPEHSGDHETLLASGEEVAHDREANFDRRFTPDEARDGCGCWMLFSIHAKTLA